MKRIVLYYLILLGALAGIAVRRPYMTARYLVLRALGCLSTADKAAVKEAFRGVKLVAWDLAK